MSDAIRMMDLAPLTRSLQEVRRADPEEKNFADRLAARAAVRHLERVHEDVAASEGPAETRVDEHSGRGGGQRQGQRQQHADGEPAKAKAVIPEVEEGRLLDIKA